jgi:hypothetical protein
MNYDNHLFHPSSLGDLMSNGQGKKDTKSIEELGETAKSKLLDIWIHRTYGRTKNITNQYMEKGVMCEEDSMDLYAVVKKQMFVKNQETFKNDFLVGTPDIITDTEVIDLKTSFDIHTFYGTMIKSVNKTYFYQLQAYMDLTGKDSAKLVYVLVNTPEKLIEDAKKKAYWRLGVIDTDNDPAYLEACKEIETNSIFDDIPREKRYIEFEIARDQDAIDSVKKRVPIWREFLNMLPQ